MRKILISIDVTLILISLPEKLTLRRKPMFVAAVIRKENQILLQQRDNQAVTVWELPNFEVYNDDNPIDFLVEKCKTLNVTIEVTDIFFDAQLDNQRFVVYNTELLSYSDNSAIG